MRTAALIFIAALLALALWVVGKITGEDPFDDFPDYPANPNSFTPPTTSPVGGGGADLAAGTANPVSTSERN